jgi:hypothetical protein
VALDLFLNDILYLIKYISIIKPLSGVNFDERGVSAGATIRPLKGLVSPLEAFVF